jgi:uncharacterized damage-inducible protein DinB
MNSPLLASLFKYKAWANEELFVCLKGMEETAQRAERHTAIRILNHVYVVDRIFEANLQDRRHGHTATNTPETPTLQSLWESVQTTDRWYCEYVSTLSRDALEEQIAFAFVDGDLGLMSREEMLAHVLTHGSYHRGAVGRVLAQVSIATPRDILTQYYNTAEPERRRLQR